MMFVPPEIREERYSICQTCPKFKKTIKLCGICKCFMPVKVKIAGAKCPDNKWGPHRKNK